MSRVSLVATLLCVAALNYAATALADNGHPVALTRTDAAGLTLETMWDVRLNLSPKEHGLAFSVATSTENDIASGVLNEQRPMILIDRHANEPWNANVVTNSSGNKGDSSNAVRVAYIKGVALVSVDGIDIAYVPDPSVLNTESSSESSSEFQKSFLLCDVLVSDGDASTNAAITKVATKRKVKLLVLKDASASSDPVVTMVDGNRMAISAAGMKGDSLKTVVLGTKPVELPKALLELYSGKEKACVASQKVFASLSVAQLNFKPSNGTHTPRWNTEHMMGRELQFFSQIFHELDPAIPVMNLNPKQMPADYKARHADWTGDEEAFQTQRVLSFTRRFAYLLKDLDLDKKAPGSFWTPRKLLLQMERHYGEHTANVQKKFKLPDWPAK